MPAPRLRISPPGPRRAAEACWDGASSTLTCQIRPLDEGAPPTLRDRIDAALHVAAPVRQAVIGGLDLVLDEDDRPVSMELYTNPLRWTRAEGASPTPEAADVALELDYDANGIASVDVPLTVEHDPSRGSLTLRFGLEVRRWYAPATGLLLGADSEDRLAAIRCEKVARGPR